MNFNIFLLLSLAALAIGIGGASSTFAFRYWESRQVKSKARTKSISLALLGVLLIGFGGNLSTYSWKVYDNESAKREITISVVNEWNYNQDLFKTSTLFSEDSASLRSYNFYPRFSNEAIRFALMSSLFDLSDSLDNRFLAILWKMERVIYDTNNRLQVTDNYSLNTLDRESVAERRRHVLESIRLKWFVNNQATLGEFLKSNYPWALTDSADITLTEK